MAYRRKPPLSRGDSGSIEVEPPTDSVIFDVTAMCQDCPALTEFGEKREDLVLSPVRSYLAITDTLEAGSGHSFWGCMIEDGAANSYDWVSVTYYGVPGEVLPPRVDAFIDAANKAVGRCALRGQADALGDVCGAEDFGVDVSRTRRAFAGFDDKGDVTTEWLGYQRFAIPNRELDV